MMNSHISFADLRPLLEGLGFTVSRKPTHWLFEHPEPDTFLVYRHYRPGDRVLPHDMAATRKLLDERGLMAADEFDRLSAKAPA